jgi:hypothetical protein
MQWPWSLLSLGKEILGPINGTASHAAEILPEIAESAFNQGRYFFFTKLLYQSTFTTVNLYGWYKEKL